MRTKINVSTRITKTRFLHDSSGLHQSELIVKWWQGGAAAPPEVESPACRGVPALTRAMTLCSWSMVREVKSQHSIFTTVLCSCNTPSQVPDKTRHDDQINVSHRRGQKTGSPQSWGCTDYVTQQSSVDWSLATVLSSGAADEDNGRQVWLTSARELLAIKLACWTHMHICTYKCTHIEGR